MFNSTVSYINICKYIVINLYSFHYLIYRYISIGDKRLNLVDLSSICNLIPKKYVSFINAIFQMHIPLRKLFFNTAVCITTIAFIYFWQKMKKNVYWLLLIDKDMSRIISEFCLSLSFVCQTNSSTIYPINSMKRTSRMDNAGNYGLRATSSTNWRESWQVECEMSRAPVIAIVTLSWCMLLPQWQFPEKRDKLGKFCHLIKVLCDVKLTYKYQFHFYIVMFYK